MKKMAVIIFIVIILSGIFAAVLSVLPPSRIKPAVITGVKYNSARDIKATDDNGYVIAGMSTAAGAGYVDAYLLKLDSHGKKQWDNYFGGAGDDRFYSVVIASNGDFVMAGATTSYGAGLADFLAVRTDKKGNIKFLRTYGTAENEEASAIMETSDGGFIIAGSAHDPLKSNRYSCMLIKIDQDGNSVWTKVTDAGFHSFKAKCIIAGIDGGYVVSGEAVKNVKEKTDAAIVKFDLSGNTVWTRAYGGNLDDSAAKIIQTDDRGYLICGTTYVSTAENNDIYLVKTDAEGDCVWARTYGDMLNEFGESVISDGKGGYVIGSTSESFTQGSSDLYIIKTDSSGTPLWSRNFGTKMDDYLGGIALSKDFGIAVTGWVKNPSGENSYNIYFVKTDSNGTY